MRYGYMAGCNSPGKNDLRYRGGKIAPNLVQYFGATSV
jgi:hypothetical protein